jgi:hypothetical protein
MNRTERRREQRAALQHASELLECMFESSRCKFDVQRVGAIVAAMVVLRKAGLSLWYGQGMVQQIVWQRVFYPLLNEEGDCRGLLNEPQREAFVALEGHIGELRMKEPISFPPEFEKLVGWCQDFGICDE